MKKRKITLLKKINILTTLPSNHSYPIFAGVPVLKVTSYHNYEMHGEHSDSDTIVVRSHTGWDPKWTQAGLKSQTALKYCSIYMAIYMEISLGRLSKQ